MDLAVKKEANVETTTTFRRRHPLGSGKGPKIKHHTSSMEPEKKKRLLHTQL